MNSYVQETIARQQQETVERAVCRRVFRPERPDPPRPPRRRRRFHWLPPGIRVSPA